MRMRKAIPSGIPVSGPLPHQFLAMYYFVYYWYCACVILFNAYLEAHGFCLQFSLISVYLYVLSEPIEFLRHTISKSVHAILSLLNCVHNLMFITTVLIIAKYNSKTLPPPSQVVFLFLVLAK